MQDIIVLKCGGSSVNDLSDSFFNNIQTLIDAGIKPVIVHGGGPAIKEMLAKVNIHSEFVDGLRKTTEPMMDIVEMVLSGNVNPTLTTRVKQTNINGIGIAGTSLLEASPINLEKYGLVGEVAHVNTSIIYKLIEADFVPIISPIALGKDGKKYNVNADTAAGAIATALKAKQLIFVTDVPGILKNDALLEEVTTEEVEKLIDEGTIFGGMIPKVQAAMSGLSGDVQEVMIVNGKQSELKTATTLAGTMIKKSGVAQL